MNSISNFLGMSSGPLATYLGHGSLNSESQMHQVSATGRAAARRSHDNQRQGADCSYSAAPSLL